MEKTIAFSSVSERLSDSIKLNQCKNTYLTVCFHTQKPTEVNFCFLYYFSVYVNLSKIASLFALNLKF